MMFRWEPINYLLATGLAELGRLSWDECGNDKELCVYDPDWARYGRMEENNILRFISVREGDELIGYASIILTDSLHDRTVKSAIVQDIFILPEHRAGGSAGKLLDFAEAQLSGIGVMHLTIAARLMVGPVGRWLTRRGYRCNEHLYTKILRARRVH